MIITIIVILFIVFLFVKNTREEKQDKEDWNDGICKVCKIGNYKTLWYYVNDDGRYTYQCDKCGNTIRTKKDYGNIY